MPVSLVNAVSADSGKYSVQLYTTNFCFSSAAPDFFASAEVASSCFEQPLITNKAAKKTNHFFIYFFSRNRSWERMTSTNEITNKVVDMAFTSGDTPTRT